MLYLSGVLRSDMPAMVTPRMGQKPPPGQPWAADNGRFSKPEEYSDDRYLAWLVKLRPDADRCLFATAPDVVGDAVSTLLLSAPMYRRIREIGYCVALVAQDGLENLTEFIPWHDFDAVFIGGTTSWKLGPGAMRIADLARAHRKWVHMGRVNSLRRMVYAESIGCDSADGTVLKHDPNRRPDRWAAHVKDRRSLWRPAT